VAQKTSFGFGLNETEDQLVAERSRCCVDLLAEVDGEARSAGSPPWANHRQL